MESRCSNGVIVSIYPDGSVKQAAHDDAFQITGLPRP